MSQRTIGVLTGGGDAPGLNAVIRAVVKTACGLNWSVIGIEDGFEGLLGSGSRRNLTTDCVRGLLSRGGSILGCTNRGHFSVRSGESGLTAENTAYDEALVNFKKFGLDALIVIGGDGSQRIACEFSRRGMPIVGVPKTIDNDLDGTDFTFGFDTALEMATDAVDRLHTTAESHDRVMLVEVMGRHAGWIALLSGIGGGADVILLPEIPFRVESVAVKVKERDAQGRAFSIVVVAEGARPAGGELTYREAAHSTKDARLGGVAERICDELTRLTEKEIRTVVLGHLQRGGRPTAFDRVLASAYGAAAVRAVAEGKFGSLVAWTNNDILLVPLERATKELKRVPLDHFLVQTARDMGISFGDR